MAITIVETAGSASANSYISEAEFNAYIETCLHVSTAVTAAQAVEGTDTIKRALVSATRLLDEQIEWDGEANEPTVQALQWPRAGLEDDKGEDLDEETIPTRIKNACAELARYLIDSDRTAESSTDGINRLAVGSIELEFNSNTPPPRKVIPDSVWQMISLWGEKSFGNSVVCDLERS
jgi:hypothetical protein